MARYLSVHLLQALHAHPSGLTRDELFDEAREWWIHRGGDPWWYRELDAEWPWGIYGVIEDAVNAGLIEWVDTGGRFVARIRSHESHSRNDEGQRGHRTHNDTATKQHGHLNGGDTGGNDDGRGSGGGGSGGGNDGGGGSGNGGPPGPNGRDGEGLGFREVMSHPILFALPRGELDDYLIGVLGVEDPQ